MSFVLQSIRWEERKREREHKEDTQSVLVACVQLNNNTCNRWVTQREKEETEREREKQYSEYREEEGEGDEKRQGRGERIKCECEWTSSVYRPGNSCVHTC